MNELVLPRPDDWHLHLRDGPVLRDAVAATAAVFGRALVMPNLKPPITTTEAARAYHDRIRLVAPPGFTPYPALYLTDATTPAEVRRAKASGVVLAAKLYPAGATTHSDAGVTDVRRLAPVFAAMEEVDLVLCLHGEVVDPDVDVFDREAVFLERTGSWLVETFPRLRLVLEHVTTAQGVGFVYSGHDRVAATITPQHLLLDRNDLFVGGLQPHHYCLPVLKRRLHREALLEAAISGSPRFFLGTDSAPHPRHAKESACGCAGCFTAPHALALYAEAFDQAGALARLPDFASGFGADFYGLPRATTQVRLVRRTTSVPQAYPFGSDEVVPLRAGGTVAWQVAPA
ncbi:MAG: dihydroorotase [Alphaproteobacteria bacterium]|nr:dihydroorotase [Alphaproteobacteria bacterium]